MLLHLLHVAHSLIREHLSKPVLRSSEWPLIRRRFLDANPTCACCGGTARMQVHHKLPFHDSPATELEPSNLIGLCMGPNECHLLVGHGGSFKMFNPTVEADAAAALADPSKLKDIQAKAECTRLVNAPGVSLPPA
jgi:hypothetical protein